MLVRENKEIFSTSFLKSRKSTASSGGKLLAKESYRIELLLKLLIGIVDAELLKTVHVERLKPAKKDQENVSPSYYMVFQHMQLCSHP